MSRPLQNSFQRPCDTHHRHSSSPLPISLEVYRLGPPPPGPATPPPPPPLPHTYHKVHEYEGHQEEEDDEENINIRFERSQIGGHKVVDELYLTQGHNEGVQHGGADVTKHLLKRQSHNYPSP